MPPHTCLAYHTCAKRCHSTHVLRIYTHTTHAHPCAARTCTHTLRTYTHTHTHTPPVLIRRRPALMHGPYCTVTYICSPRQVARAQCRTRHTHTDVHTTRTHTYTHKHTHTHTCTLHVYARRRRPRSVEAMRPLYYIAAPAALQLAGGNSKLVTTHGAAIRWAFGRRRQVVTIDRKIQDGQRGVRHHHEHATEARS